MVLCLLLITSCVASVSGLLNIRRMLPIEERVNILEQHWKDQIRRNTQQDEFNAQVLKLLEPK